MRVSRSRSPARPDPGNARPPDPNESGLQRDSEDEPGRSGHGAHEIRPASGQRHAQSRLPAHGITGAEYVWHCHILEHEEHDMMHALVVV